MTVPVLWWGDRAEYIRRGYWDQAMLEELLVDGLWHVAGLPVFEHFEGVGLPDGRWNGAVLVVPARWYLDDVARLNDTIRPLEWAMVLLCGDEEGVFPWRDLRHPNLVVWVQTAHPGIHPNTGAGRGGTRYRWFGDGWPPGTRENLARNAELGERPMTTWWFHGQLNNDARQACVQAMTTRRKERNDGECHITRVFGSGLPQEEYLKRMLDAQVIPAPSGTYSVDTFRFFEALEAARVPVVDRAAPRTPGEVTYWETLFGADLPFPVLDNWAKLPGAIDKIIGGWPEQGNRCFAWWQARKRDMAYQFVEDLTWAANRPEVPATDEAVTVLIPTSPIPTHPDLAVIEETVESVRRQLPRADILVMVDGVRPEQAHRRAAYQEYIRRLCWKANYEWRNVLPVVFPEWLHQAEMTRRTLDLVRSPYILFVEHDTPLINDTDFAGLEAALDTGEANVIRLHHEASILEPHRYLMLDDQPRLVGGTPMRATVQWSQRPHLARTEFYRGMIADYFGKAARTMIEDVMYGVLITHHRVQRIAGWEKFRVFIYTPDDTTIQRSWHSDGRKVGTPEEEPKFGMLWRYDTAEPPLGAPAPHAGMAPADDDPDLCPCVAPE